MTVAGEWIKVRTNLWNDPRVSQLCDVTECPEAMIVGGLYWLWATADEHTETGLMPGLSTTAIDRKTGIKGFGSALVSIGWVEDTPDGIILARFDEHNGSSAKARAQTAKRVANHKTNALVTPKHETANAVSVTSALPREEKRREEVKETPLPPAGGKVSRKRLTTSFPEFLADCKANSLQPIPESAPVFAYAAQAGISQDFLRLQWLEFKDRYGDGAKRYKDWPAVFSKSVRGNWFKLWYADKGGGGYVLSTIGIQADNTHRKEK